MTYAKTFDTQSSTSLLLLKIPEKASWSRLSDSYTKAFPFAHIFLDEFFGEDISSSTFDFPSLDWSGWSRFQDEYQKGKRVCNQLDLFPAQLRQMVIEAAQPRFLQFLEAVTGIGGLIPDPYLTGGGMHSSGPGGILAPHTDFHVYEQLELYRRVNVLFFFNKDWKREDGGSLELSLKGAETPSVSILPLFGRAVIFNTDDRSVHGFTTPVAQGRQRNSLALYYYTAKETGFFAGDRTTHWQQHGSEAGLRGMRILAYKSFLLGSRALSRLAHLANPNVKHPLSGERGAGNDKELL